MSTGSTGSPGPSAGAPTGTPPTDDQDKTPWLLNRKAGFFFVLNLLYLVILVTLLIGRWRGWAVIRDLPDPIGGIIPLAVPWFGALGAIAISLYGVFDHTRRGNWNTGWNYWHAGRPIVGALLGTVAFLIFVGVINATGASPELSGPATNVIPYIVLAFLVGYREATFRDLIKRATDLLLAPGTAAASVSISPQRVDFGTVTVGATADRQLTISNSGSADLEIGAGAVHVDGDGFGLVGDGVDQDATVAPRSMKAVTLRFSPTSPGDRKGNVIVQTSVGAVSSELIGVGK